MKGKITDIKSVSISDSCAVVTTGGKMHFSGITLTHNKVVLRLTRLEVIA